MRRILADGMYAGVIGYAVVVLVTAAVNLLAGRSAFYTAALFGSALFYGLESPAALEIAAGPVLAFNTVHLLVFLGFGLLAAWLVNQADKYPVARYAALCTLIFVGAHIYAALVLFAQPLLAGAAWWQIGGPGVLAALAMGGYLLWVHPVLRSNLWAIPMGAEGD